MSNLQSELAALHEEETRAAGRALAAAADALAILREDLPAFVEREAKRAFLLAPSFADGLSDEAIAAIKRDLADAARDASGSILEALSGDGPWLAGVDHIAGDDDDDATFEDNPAVWSPVAEIAATTRAVLDRHGFPPSGQDTDLRYRQPAFFVGGRHMKSVAEHYWRALRDVRDLRLRSEQVTATARLNELRSRWDSVEV